jgi:2-C-methyl-D-erythritol 4-phosphate cytidylyltransferase
LPPDACTGSDADVWAIVLAAGAGARFGGHKQFAPAAGRPLLDWSCAAVASVCQHVILVLPAGRLPATLPAGVSQFVTGGATRQLSVAAALGLVPRGVETVVVHDAAHPGADVALVAAVLAALWADVRAAAAVPVLPVHETLVRAGPDGVAASIATGRGSLQVQMPHTFRTNALRAATESSMDAPDEATVLLLAGERVILVPGSPANIHVTSPAELALVNVLLKNGSYRTCHP